MRTLFKFIIGLICFLVFGLIVLLVIGIVLINMSPNKLKIGDKTIINGKSFNDLGIGDTKFKKLIKDFKNIKNNEKNVSKNPVNKEKEEERVKDIMSIYGLVDGDNVNYQELFTTGLDTMTTHYQEYSDKTVAYIMNNSIEYFMDDAESIKNLKFGIDEITFDGDGKEMRVVFSTDISEFKKKVEDACPDLIDDFIGIPKKVYFVSYFTVSVTDQGRLDLEHKNVLINDLDCDLTIAVLNALSTETNDIKGYNNMLGDAIEEAMSYLGKIGTAEADSNGVITGSYNLGIDGYMNNRIGFICGN